MPDSKMLEFDAAQHRYSVATVTYPSVSQILAELRLTPPYPDEDRGQKAFGTACHKATELVALGRLDKDGTSPKLLPYVMAVEKKFEEMRVVPIKTELMMYDPIDGYAGTTDLFCWILNGELAVVDYKTGTVPNCCELQTTGYERLIKRSAAAGRIDLPDKVMEHLSAKKPVLRYSMRVMDGRAIMKQYTNPFDWQAWSGALDLYKWLRDRRKS